MKLKSVLLFATLGALSINAQADTLEEVYQSALANDLQLKAASARYAAGQEYRNLGRAALLPQVSGSYSYSNSDIDDDTGNTDVDVNSMTVGVQQTLFNLAAWRGNERGAKLADQAEASFQYDKQELIVRVASAYFDVLRAQENLAAAKAQEKAIERQLEQTQQRFDVGLIAITDVHEARAAFDLALASRLALEGALDIAKEALTVITGRQHANLWDLSDEFQASSPSPADINTWVTSALEQNYMLRASELGVDAAEKTFQIQKAGHLPTLTGSYSYTDSESDGTAYGQAFDSNEDRATIAIQLNVPIYSGGAVSAARRQSYQNYLSTLESHNQSKRSIIQATRSFYIAVTTDAARVKARKQAITSAQSALDATQAGYDVGTRNVVDVLNAQQALYRAQRDYANARYDYVINLLKLKQQAGNLNEQDILMLEKNMRAPADALASQS